MAGWRGYYINLDRSQERRAAMEARIAGAGLAGRYERFAAVDGAVVGATKRLTASAHGCFLSHLTLIEQHVRGDDFIHIIEDDVVFSARAGGEIDRGVAAGSFANSDLVFLGVIVVPETDTVQRLKNAGDAFRVSQQFLFIDLKGFPFGGTASYLVNPASAGKVANALRRGLSGGGSLPIDLYYRQEINAGRLRATCIFPFLTTTDVSPSTIQSDTDSLRITLEMSASFLVDADHAAGLKRIAAIVGEEPADPHLDLLAAVQRFRLSKRWQTF